MVDRALEIGTPCASATPMTERAVQVPRASARAWIVEDEPEAAALAAELCAASGAEPSVFRTPLPFLEALRVASPPDVVVLDWRLEQQLTAALFLATRHRHPELPIVFWTGSPLEALPAMVRQDAHAVVVDKAAGTRAFELAVTTAISESDGATPGPPAVEQA